MKNLVLNAFVLTFLFGCQNPKLDSPDNHEMSGIIKGTDNYTEDVKRFMNSYVENNMTSAKDIFSKNAVFYVNDSKLNIDDMIVGFSLGHQFFDNISHDNLDIATMYYNNGSVYTNVWYEWKANKKSTGEALNIKGYGWFKWNDGKVVEAYNAFDPTLYSAAMNSQIPNSEPAVTQLIDTAKAFQNAYIVNDYPTASTYLSNNFDTTIYNSNGQPLAIQNREQIENSGAGWDFGRFEMSNFKVSFSKNKYSATVTFDTDGIINFDNGQKNIPYSTRASQFWVSEDGVWKIMHSHWSPKSDSEGIPKD